MDGFVRLFDKRYPLPIMTFDAMYQSSASTSSSSVTPDGLPCELEFYDNFLSSISLLIVITDHKESVKVWDVRGQSMLYEIATGNDSD
jgi:hypothetical protein